MTTNYERIKNMTVEEMAEFLRHNFIFRCTTCPYNKDCGAGIGCYGGLKQWLQAESEE